LLVWQKGLQIAADAFKLVSSFPGDQKYSLSSQITRAAVSIPSNIAEGSSRNSEKDYSRFLEISLGSAYEMETQLLIAESINFGSKELRQSLLKDIDEEQKMLMSFIIKIRH
jgi:four helix bundle protein